jgi:hypothetical protein
VSRTLLAATLILAAATSLDAQQPSPPDLEEAAEFARHAAAAAVGRSPRVFSEALDVDAILARHIGAAAWNGLTERQRDRLRAFVRERFLGALAAPRGEQGEIAWSAARAGGLPSSWDVFLGLKFGERVLKTRWVVSRGTTGFSISDVLLADPGISLARAATRSLGPEPVRRRNRGRQARSEALPRVVGLVVIALVVLLAARRLSPDKRRLLYWTAVAPTVLFAGDGFLAVRRVLSEPYALEEHIPREPWSEASEGALRAQRAGRFEESREHWAQALAAGEDPGPIEYQIGLAYQARGELDHARAQFERALRERPPAPGAAREMAAMAVAAGRQAEAEQWLKAYLALAGPDPDSLALAAVVESNLGKSRESLAAIQEARAMVGEGWRAAELEARVRARAGDAAGAVAALRPLEAEGRLDRSALRASPDYLRIATDPVWVAFLNEKTK